MKKQSVEEVKEEKEENLDALERALS